MEVKYNLIALEPPMGAAWQWAFADKKRYNVDVHVGDMSGAKFRPILEGADAVVSASNSTGEMQGGLDGFYQRWWGDLQSIVQETIQLEYAGELIVGEAAVVDISKIDHPTDIPRPRYMIYAPTMRTPGDVSGTVNAYLAFRAILRAVQAHNSSHRKPDQIVKSTKSNQIRSVVCPGLATGVGEMPYARAAYQFRVAYDAVINGEGPVYRIFERTSLQRSNMLDRLMRTVKQPFDLSLEP